VKKYKQNRKCISNKSPVCACEFSATNSSWNMLGQVLARNKCRWQQEVGARARPPERLVQWTRAVSGVWTNHRSRPSNKHSWETVDGQFSSHLRLDGRSRCSFLVAAGDTRLVMPARTARTPWPLHGEYPVRPLGVIVWVREVPSSQSACLKGTRPAHLLATRKATFWTPSDPPFTFGTLFSSHSS